MEDISREEFTNAAQYYIQRAVLSNNDIITSITQDDNCIIIKTPTKNILFCKQDDDTFKLHFIYDNDTNKLCKFYNSIDFTILDKINMKKEDIFNGQIDCNVVILEKIENNILYFLHVDLDYEIETYISVKYTII
jgi:hypothetical protein